MIIIYISIIKVEGELEVEPYTSKETPMIIYLNTHAALEQMRMKVNLIEHKLLTWVGMLTRPLVVKNLCLNFYV